MGFMQRSSGGRNEAPHTTTLAGRGPSPPWRATRGGARLVGASHRQPEALPMPRREFPVLVFGALIASACLAPALSRSSEPENGPTKMLRSPTVSATQIAFAYAQNIWIVDRKGGAARRLTSFQVLAATPRFSPDGKWIAFSGQYAGNLDVYVVAADGGEPKRLTWHPGPDEVQGWTPDGKSVV